MRASTIDEPINLRFKTPIDRDSAPFYAVSVMVHVVALVVIMSFPDNASSLELDGVDLNDRFLQLALTPEQLEEPSVTEFAGPPESGDAAHRGDEGRSGEEAAPETDRKLAIEGPRENEDVELRHERDQQIAMNSGIANTLNAESPWGTSTESVGNEAISALANLDGLRVGKSGGIGIGVSGNGRGGGSDVEGSIGLDHKVETKGRESGYGAKAGCPLCGSKDEVIPGEVTWRPPVVEGGLDREIIQRVVRRQRRGIKACYEAELTKNRQLAGEVKVKFTVAPSGEVIAALVEHSSLGSAAVESCMTKRIRRWVFPEPRGGQMVIVKYPFRFTSR